MKQLTCQNCHKTFNAIVKIGNKRKELYKRSYCLNCAPYGRKVRKQLSKYKIIHGVEHKQCSRCNLFKDAINDFYCTKSKYNNKSYPGSHCKQCLTDRSRDNGRDMKAKAVEYKGGLCIDCMIAYPDVVYDFHHKNPKQKDFAISAFQGIDWQKLKIELDKCDLLCANCHRIRHDALLDNH